MADFFDLLNKRRAIRDFQEKEVPMKLLMDIIKDSCLAPSANNGQPWKCIIINQKEMIKRLSDESKKNLLSDIETNHDSPIKKYESWLQNKTFNVFYNAPCLVYIVGHREIPSLYVDCALFACYFMFSASERKLGTCWVHLGSAIRNPETLKKIGLPEDHIIVAPIIVGYPKSIPTPPHRYEPQILKVIS